MASVKGPREHHLAEGTNVLHPISGPCRKERTILQSDYRRPSIVTEHTKCLSGNITLLNNLQEKRPLTDELLRLVGIKQCRFRCQSDFFTFHTLSKLLSAHSFIFQQELHYIL